MDLRAQGEWLRAPTGPGQGLTERWWRPRGHGGPGGPRGCRGDAPVRLRPALAAPEPSLATRRPGRGANGRGVGLAGGRRAPRRFRVRPRTRGAGLQSRGEAARSTPPPQPSTRGAPSTRAAGRSPRLAAGGGGSARLGSLRPRGRRPSTLDPRAARVPARPAPSHHSRGRRSRSRRLGPTDLRRAGGRRSGAETRPRSARGAALVGAERRGAPSTGRDAQSGSGPVRGQGPWSSPNFSAQGSVRTQLPPHPRPRGPPPPRPAPIPQLPSPALRSPGSLGLSAVGAAASGPVEDAGSPSACASTFTGFKGKRVKRPGLKGDTPFRSSNARSFYFLLPLFQDEPTLTIVCSRNTGDRGVRQRPLSSPV